VLDHAIAFENPVESGQRAAPIDHIIFGNNLKPVHYWCVFEDMLVVRNAKTDSDSVILKSVKSIGRHKRITGSKLVGIDPVW
jgi:hypothetical protein